LKITSLGCASALFLAACSAPVSENDKDVQSEIVTEESRAFAFVDHAYVRPPLGGKTMTVGYLNLSLTENDRLTAVEAEFAKSIEIHTHENEDGVMKMRKLDGLDISANQTVEFKPKGLHLMIFGVSDLELGATEDVKLIFQSGREEIVRFDIMQSKPAEEAGHKH